MLPHLSLKVVLGIDCAPQRPRPDKYFAQLTHVYEILAKLEPTSRDFGAWSWTAVLSDRHLLEAWYSAAPDIWRCLDSQLKGGCIRGFKLASLPASDWDPRSGQVVRFGGLTASELNGVFGVLRDFSIARQRWAVCFWDASAGSSVTKLFKVNNLILVDEATNCGAGDERRLGERYGQPQIPSGFALSSRSPS